MIDARDMGLEVLGLIGGSMPANPDLPTRLNVEEMPEVTGAEYWGHLPEGCGRLGTTEFAEAAWDAIGEAVRVGSRA